MTRLLESTPRKNGYRMPGYPVYGLSNWSNETFPRLRHRYPFLNELDDYLLSGMAGVAKPDEEIFRIFLQRINRQAEDCVFIDDAQVNIDAANRLGFYFGEERFCHPSLDELAP